MSRSSCSTGCCSYYGSGDSAILVPGLMLKPGTSITPMEKYDAENAKLEVVDVMPLRRIPLVDE